MQEGYTGSHGKCHSRNGAKIAGQNRRRRQSPFPGYESRWRTATEDLEKGGEVLGRAGGLNLHAPVGQVANRAPNAEQACLPACPPAKADALHSSAQLDGEARF